MANKLIEARAKGDWIAQITIALSDDHHYLGSGSISLADTLNEIQDEEDDKPTTLARSIDVATNTDSDSMPDPAGEVLRKDVETCLSTALDKPRRWLLIAFAVCVAWLSGCEMYDYYGHSSQMRGAIERGPTDPAGAAAYQRLYGPLAAHRDHHH